MKRNLFFRDSISLSNGAFSGGLIVKSNDAPDWRKFQKTLGKWNTTHKDGHTMSKTASLNEQFSAEERRKIDMACHYTNKLSIDMNDNPFDDSQTMKDIKQDLKDHFSDKKQF